MCSEVEVLLLRRFFWWKNTAENVQIFSFKSHDLRIHVIDLVGLCPNVTSMSVVFSPLTLTHLSLLYFYP